MNPFPISVVTLGPGSQTHEEDEALDFIPMPQGMNTFDMPRFPDIENPVALAAAVALLQTLLARMRAWRFDTSPHPRLALEDCSPEVLRVVNDALGQGEVSAIVHEGDHILRIQETVFAGVWRMRRETTDGALRADWIEACAVPVEIAGRANAAGTGNLEIPVLPDGVMNAPVLLNEIRDVAAAFNPGDAAHVINLTLLPLTPPDLECLVNALGSGPSVVLSRGYGNCRVSSTALADTWWVQYYNNGDNLILNTIEITTLPDVVPASADDYADSVERLAEWIDALQAD